MKTAFKVLSLILTLALICGESSAQSYPKKSIKFVVGYPPGGTTDSVARIIGQKLSERLGQAVIVENKPGADSIIAAEYVKNAAPDGYTLFIGGSGVMVFNPGLYDHLSYDPVKDFIPITQFVANPLVFAVNSSVPAYSLKDLISLAKAKPGELFYASGASPFHAATELLKKQADVNIVHIPYKGSAPSITAAVAGQVPIVAVELPAALAQLKAGKIRALAVSGSKRSAVLPDIPTVADSGLAGYELMMWTGLFAPLGTPREITDKLYSELSSILNQESMKERLASFGYETSAIGMPPAEFGAMHKAEVNKWTKISKDLHVIAN